MAVNAVASFQASKLFQVQGWKTQGMIDKSHRQLPGKASFVAHPATNNIQSIVPAVSAMQGNKVPGINAPATTPSTGSSSNDNSSFLGRLLDLSL